MSTFEIPLCADCGWELNAAFSRYDKTAQCVKCGGNTERLYQGPRKGDWVSLSVLENADMLTHKERATIRAALLFFKREGWGSSGHEIDIACDGDDEPLSSEEIDRLARLYEDKEGE